MSDAAPDIDWTDVEASTNGKGHVRSITREPPHDDAAERAVLGAAILRPDLIPALSAIIRDDAWYQPAHSAIWAAIVDREARGRPVDTITIAADVGTERALRDAGGPLYVNDLANDPNVTPSDATWHARIVADRATDRRTVALGTWLTQAGHNATDTDTVAGRLTTHLTDRNPALRTAVNTSWAHVDLTDALAGLSTEDVPTLMPRSDGPCLLYPGVNVIAGEPASGKTWLALHAVADELRRGHDVVYLDFEDRASRVVARLLAIGAKPDDVRDHLRYVRPDLALDAAGRADLAQEIHGTTLAVLDGVTEAMTLHGLDLSSNPDVATFYALLPRWIADQGPTVLLIDHVVKDAERQGRWSIGGQHKLAGLDGASYTVRSIEPFGRGRRGTSRVFIAKDRHGHVEEHALGRCAAEFHLDSTDPNVSVAQLDPPEAMPTSEAGDMRPTVLMERVSRWLELNPGSTGKNIEDAKFGKAQYVRRAIQELITEGHVGTTPGARSAVHHHSIEPFRRDQETPDESPI